MQVTDEQVLEVGEQVMEEHGEVFSNLAKLELTEKPVIKTAEMVKEELKQLKYTNFLINFKPRLEQWEKSHDGRKNYPIRYDSTIGDFVWLSREQRRQR